MPRLIGNVILRGNTHFRLWNGINSSMSDAVADYTGSFTAYGALDHQFLITDLYLVNTLADISYVEYATVTNSHRTGPGFDINALNPTNVDNAGNIGWKFAHQMVINDNTIANIGGSFALILSLEIDSSTHEHTSNKIVLESLETLIIIDGTDSHTSQLLHLSGGSVVGIQGSQHACSSDVILLLGPQASRLHMVPEVHAHTSDKLALSVTLQIGSSWHAHKSDKVILSLLGTRTATQAHTSGVLSLGTAVTLIINSSRHTHTGNLVVLRTTEQSTILIYRDMQIIDRQVCTQPNYPIKTIGYFDIPEEFVVSLTNGTGYETGGHFGVQHFLRVPGIASNTWYGSVGQVYLQHAETTVKISKTYVPIYRLDPVKTQKEKIRQSKIVPLKKDML
jgi:hypothetical protein